MPIEKGTGYRIEFPMDVPEKERIVIEGRGTRRKPALNIDRMLILVEYLTIRQNVSPDHISVTEYPNTYVNTDPVNNSDALVIELFAE